MLDQEDFQEAIAESSRTIAGLTAQAAVIARVASLVVAALQSARKVLTAGNGGSAAEALHMAEELAGRYRSNRRPLPAVALVADGTTLTCIGNDFGFENIFSRQVEALGCPGDVLLVMSTSGASRNLLTAVEKAQAIGMTTICLLGKDGGPLAGKADCEIIVPARSTERIQEAHQVIVHLILEAVENAFAH